MDRKKFALWNKSLEKARLENQALTAQVDDLTAQVAQAVQDTPVDVRPEPLMTSQLVHTQTAAMETGLEFYGQSVRAAV